MKQMKKILSLLCFTFLLCLAIPQKASAAVNIVGDFEQSYTYKAQYVTVNLKSDEAWKATTNDSFISLSTTTGSGNGYQSQLCFSLSENTSSNPRMGFITLYPQSGGGPIMCLEIYQAAAYSAKPGVNPYFTCDTPFSTNIRSISYNYNTTSVKMKFFTNQKLTLKINNNSVTPVALGNNAYEYTLSLGGVNYTTADRVFTITANVDGTNVEGGNNHTYTVIQKRLPVNEPTLKLVDGRIEKADNKRHRITGDPVFEIKTNDDIEYYYTYHRAIKSDKKSGKYTTSTAIMKLPTLSYSSLKNGITYRFTEKSMIKNVGGYFNYYDDIYLYYRAVHSSDRSWKRYDLNIDYRGPSYTDPNNEKKPSTDPQDNSIFKAEFGEIMYMKKDDYDPNGVLTVDNFKKGTKIEDIMPAFIGKAINERYWNVKIELKDINQDWVLLEYNEGRNVIYNKVVWNRNTRIDCGKKADSFPLYIQVNGQQLSTYEKGKDKFTRIYFFVKKESASLFDKTTDDLQYVLSKLKEGDDYIKACELTFINK